MHLEYPNFASDYHFKYRCETCTCMPLFSTLSHHMIVMICFFYIEGNWWPCICGKMDMELGWVECIGWDNDWILPLIKIVCVFVWCAYVCVHICVCTCIQSSQFRKVVLSTPTSTARNVSDVSECIALWSLLLQKKRAKIRSSGQGQREHPSIIKSKPAVS